MDEADIQLVRSKARAAYDQARARRERAKADLIERTSIPLEYAREQVAALADGVRRQLDLAPSFLSADLTPEIREAATVAMADAISRALNELNLRETIKAPE